MFSFFDGIQTGVLVWFSMAGHRPDGDARPFGHRMRVLFGSEIEAAFAPLVKAKELPKEGPKQEAERAAAIERAEGEVWRALSLGVTGYGEDVDRLEGGALADFIFGQTIGDDVAPEEAEQRRKALADHRAAALSGYWQLFSERVTAAQRIRG